MRHLVERQPVSPLAREDRQAGRQDEVQLLVALLEVEPHHPLRDHRHTLDVAEILAVARVRQLAGQHLKGMPHVLREHRITVPEPGSRVQAKGDRQLVGCEVHVFREKSIDRERLVPALISKGFEHQLAEPCPCNSAQREGVDLVERAETVPVDGAAAGGVRVHVVEVPEVCRVSRLRPPRKAMGRDRWRRRERRCQGCQG
jgi:hypothetical protein